jgi:hypothetical protein
VNAVTSSQKKAMIEVILERTGEDRLIFRDNEDETTGGCKNLRSCILFI